MRHVERNRESYEWALRTRKTEVDLELAALTARLALIKIQIAELEPQVNTQKETQLIAHEAQLAGLTIADARWNTLIGALDAIIAVIPVHRLPWDGGAAT
jgi:hypothetical protein